MAAYVLADITILDPDLYEDYRRQVPALIEKYGGRYLVRGGASEVLEGEWQPNRLIVLEFPDIGCAPVVVSIGRLSSLAQDSPKGGAHHSDCG